MSGYIPMLSEASGMEDRALAFLQYAVTYGSMGAVRRHRPGLGVPRSRAVYPQHHASAGGGRSLRSLIQQMPCQRTLSMKGCLKFTILQAISIAVFLLAPLSARTVPFEDACPDPSPDRTAVRGRSRRHPARRRVTPPVHTACRVTVEPGFRLDLPSSTQAVCAEVPRLRSRGLPLPLQRPFWALYVLSVYARWPTLFFSDEFLGKHGGLGEKRRRWPPPLLVPLFHQTPPIRFNPVRGNRISSQ